MDTRAFLDHFLGNTCFVAIDDKRKDRSPVHYHEGYGESRDEILTQLNMKNRGKSGHGIFFCVNEINRDLIPHKQRVHQMVVRCRAVFIDDDNVRETHRTDFRLDPSIIVESSPGKYHYYWLTETTLFDEWEQVMSNLVITENGDPSARDLVRVMRVPGYKHLKRDAFLTRVVSCEGKNYSWKDIKDAWPPIEDVPVKAVGGNTVTVNNLSKARSLIKSGQNYHEATRYIGLHYVNKGLDRDEVSGLIQDLFETCEVKDERWQQRCSQLDDNVKDWFNFVEENPLVTVPTVSIKEKQVNLRWPPGIMGDLCREIHEMAHHPNQELAIMAGFSLIAGIAGRSFNINGSGLNLYIACLGRTGIGKSIIKDSINKALREVGALNNGASFIGPARVTGPKALLKALAENPTKLLVMEESGLLSASAAGDSHGINRVLLELYTSSGKDQWFGAEAYSDTKESSLALRAPSLTIAHVSTPESYIEALRSKDATNSGDLARIWTLRTLRDKAYLNRKRRLDYSEGVSERINQVLSLCKVNQRADPVVVDMDSDHIDLKALDIEWTDKENELVQRDPLKATIASRAVLKILKIAGVASVFNDTGGKIGMDEYLWAKQAVHEEYSTINIAVKMNDATDMDAAIEYYAMPAVTKILNRGYKAKGANASVKYAHRGMFSKANFYQALKYNSVIKKMDSDIKRSHKSSSGIDKMLDAMVNAGLLHRLSKDQSNVIRKNAQIFAITNQFENMVRSVGLV